MTTLENNEVELVAGGNGNGVVQSDDGTDCTGRPLGSGKLDPVLFGNGAELSAA